MTVGCRCRCAAVCRQLSNIARDRGELWRDCNIVLPSLDQAEAVAYWLGSKAPMFHRLQIAAIPVLHSMEHAGWLGIAAASILSQLTSRGSHLQYLYYTSGTPAAPGCRGRSADQWERMLATAMPNRPACAMLCSTGVAAICRR
jgi:hypothetical protein